MNAKFLEYAIEIALNKSKDGLHGPFGAVMVKNGTIISEGWNQVVELNDPTAHAEINAIRKACRILNSHELQDCIIYSSCEPCPMCLSALYWARVRKVYYAATRFDAAAAGFDDSFIYDELDKAPDQKTIELKQITLPQATSPFDVWIDNPDKISY